MKTYKNKSLSDTINSVGSMLIFLLFAVCMLLMIGVAAGTYSRINNAFEQTFGTGASLRYLSNKIKSAKNVEIGNNGSALLLIGEDYTDVIYFADSGLYEKNIASDADVEYSGGDMIFSMNELDVSEEDSMYKITVVIGNKQESVLVRRE